MKTKKQIVVTVTTYGGSGIKSSHTEIRDVGPRKSRPMFAMSGSRRCGGLHIEKRTEKFYSKLEWQMRNGGK